MGLSMKMFQDACQDCGARREDPDAELQKSKRFIPNKDTRQKQRTRLSRIIKNTLNYGIQNKTVDY